MATSINFPSYSTLYTYAILGGTTITSVGTGTTINNSQVNNIVPLYGVSPNTNSSVSGSYTGGNLQSGPLPPASTAISELGTTSSTTSATLIGAIKSLAVVPIQFTNSTIPTTFSSPIADQAVVYEYTGSGDLNFNAITTFSGPGQIVIRMNSTLNPPPNINFKASFSQTILATTSASNIYWYSPAQINDESGGQFLYGIFVAGTLISLKQSTTVTGNLYSNAVVSLIGNTISTTNLNDIYFLTDLSYNELNTYTILGGGTITNNTSVVINSSSSNYGYGTSSGSITGTGTFTGGIQNNYPNSAAAYAQILNLYLNVGYVINSSPFYSFPTSSATITPGSYGPSNGNDIDLTGQTITFSGSGQYIISVYNSYTSYIKFTNCTFIYNGVDPSSIFWYSNNGITVIGPTTIPGIFLSYGQDTTYTPFITGINTIFDGNLYAWNLISGSTNQGDTTLTSVILNPQTACFLKGTKILTDRGYFPIEELKIEDNVIIHGSILDNSEVVLYEKIQSSPIRWIGKFNSYRHDASDLPVCFKVGSLGEFLPEKDLFVSPGHRMILDGKMVVAKNLVNGETIVQEDTHETIEYYHFELDCHGIIMTEGVLSETFLELGDSKLAFDIF
uniref:Hedgehog/Intein (Hint) domain-containing protein n=1 Tax=viral metagenome TaxID=1070528 RepID=A0A6C0LGS2_9ZZZZ